MSIETRSNQYGTLFGDWKIVKMLGSGSNGKSAVFKLRRESVPGRVEYCALKVANLIEEHSAPEQLSDYQTNEYQKAAHRRREEALREVLLMQQLQGKTNIVDYKDYRFEQWEDESGFGVDMLIRMELLSDLRGQLRQGRRYQETEIIRIGMDICQALMICHGKGILHRDIKPENIFYNEDGDYKLGDFGISRVLGASSMASTGTGTLAYAAPEQSGGRYDTRVDIYSLGLVLYELGNENRLPFAESSYVLSAEIEKRLVGAPLPAPCGVSKALADVILKACAFRPEERYQTVQDFRQALEQALAGVEPWKQPRTQNAYATVPADRYKTKGKDIYATQAADNTVPDAYRTMPANADTAFSKAGYGCETVFAESQPESGKIKTPDGAEKRGHRRIVIAAVFVICLGLALCIGMLLKKEKVDEDVNSTAGTTLPTEQETEPEETTVPETQVTTVPEETEPETPFPVLDVIGAGREHTAYVRSDGTVIASGLNEEGQCNVSTWSDIVAVCSGDFHTVGLRANGSVLATGRNTEGQCDVSAWSGIVLIAAGDYHTVGIKADGSILATGRNNLGQCDVSALQRAAAGREIISVAAGMDHTVILLADGTAVAVGNNKYGQLNVESWTDIVQIYAATYHTVGLRADGTVVATGINDQGQCEVWTWTDMVALSAGDDFTMGLRGDGTVVATGRNAEGQCNVYDWTKIVSIAGGSNHAVGLKEDGTLVAVGRNNNGQYDLVNWD